MSLKGRVEHNLKLIQDADNQSILNPLTRVGYMDQITP